MGTFLVLLGVGLLVWQIRAARLNESDATRTGSSPTEDEQEFRRRQFRRRGQVAGLLILIGLMIPLGDFIVDWRARGAVAGTIYWAFVLLLAMWVGMLGMADLLSTRTRGRVSLSRLRQKQQALEQEVARLRAESRGEVPRRD